MLEALQIVTEDDAQWSADNANRRLRLRHATVGDTSRPGPCDAVLVANMAPKFPGLRIRVGFAVDPGSVAWDWLKGHRSYGDSELLATLRAMLPNMVAQEKQIAKGILATFEA
jgi:hypothetical protein